MKHDKGWRANKDTDKCGITNADRASRVEELLEYYAKCRDRRWHTSESELPYYCADMIADLLHLAASNGWDAEDVLRRADMHFQAER